LGIFNQFLHTYYTLISTLDDKFLFNYSQPFVKKMKNVMTSGGGIFLTHTVVFDG